MTPRAYFLEVCRLRKCGVDNNYFNLIRTLIVFQLLPFLIDIDTTFAVEWISFKEVVNDALMDYDERLRRHGLPVVDSPFPDQFPQILS